MFMPNFPQAPMPPDSIEENPPQSPGIMGQIAGGIQSRNLIPALLLGGILGMVPPLFYKKRGRSAAARDWGAIGTSLAFNELNRPERERQEKLAAMGPLLSSGVLTATTPQAGGPPVGSMGGIPLYKTPTVAEQFPDLFQTTVPAAQGVQWEPASGPPVLGGIPDPLSAFTPPAYTEPPPSMQMMGGLPATEANTQKVAKITYDQQLLEEARQQHAEDVQLFQGILQKNPDLIVTPSLGAKGITYSTRPKPSAKTGKESLMERQIRLENETRVANGQSLMSSAEENTFIDMKKGSLGKDIVQMMRQTDARMTRQQAKALQDKLIILAMAVPDEYKQFVTKPDLWEKLGRDQDAMGKMQEGLHGNITMLHELIAEKQEELEALMAEAQAARPARTKPGMAVVPPGADLEARAERMIKEMFPGK